jgi:hypothetical protein
MRSISFLAACTILATQLFGCGEGAGVYDPETGATTVTYEHTSADAVDGSVPGDESGADKRRIHNTTETCREEGSDRNYICTRCDTAHTTTITCVPRPVVVVGFSQ